MDTTANTEIFSEEEWDILVNELSLSPRQSEVIYLLLNDHSDKQIARALEIAVPTVRTHLSRLFSRFKLQDRHELILHIFYHFRKRCRADKNGCPFWLSRHGKL